MLISWKLLHILLLLNLIRCLCLCHCTCTCTSRTRSKCVWSLCWSAFAITTRASTSWATRSSCASWQCTTRRPRSRRSCAASSRAQLCASCASRYPTRRRRSRGRREPLEATATRSDASRRALPPPASEAARGRGLVARRAPADPTPPGDSRRSSMVWIIPIVRVHYLMNLLNVYIERVFVILNMNVYYDSKWKIFTFRNN